MQLRTLLFASERSLAVGLGLLVLRLFAGLAMAFAHGLGKVPPSEGFIEATAGLGFPAPTLFAWMAGLAELVGGVLVALGLLTRPASFFLVVTMAVAAFGAHAGDPFGDKEMALLYGAVFLCTMLTGSGRFGLDRFLAPPQRRSLSFA
ncbi:MAG: DoxX family protein [Bacteroidota bacterium]